MAALWGGFLEVFQVGLFWLTQFYGGHLASAIVTFSLLARIRQGSGARAPPASHPAATGSSP